MVVWSNPPLNGVVPIMKVLFNEWKPRYRWLRNRHSAVLISTVAYAITLASGCTPTTEVKEQGQTVTGMEISPTTVLDFVTDTTLFIGSIYDGVVAPDAPKGSRIVNAVWKWSSSNPSVIELVQNEGATTQNPKFVARSIGTATITGSLNDPRLKFASGVPTSATIPVTITEKPVSARLVPHGGTIRVGQTLAMHWEVQTASGQPTNLGAQTLAKFLCLNQAIANDSNGDQTPNSCGDSFGNQLNLKGLSPGTTKVALFWSPLFLKYVDTAVVTVLPAITATRVTVDPTSVSLMTGGTKQLTATVYDQSNAIINGAPVQWLPSNTSVATVSTAGLLKAESTNSADSAKVQVIARAATGVEATANVTVYRAVSSVVVSPNPKTLQAGATQTFSYALKATNNSDVPLNLTTVTWSTGSNSIATVNQTGVVSAVAAGTTKVTATTTEGIAGSADLTVEAVPLATVVRVVVTPASVTLKLSDAKCQFTAKAFDANGNQVQVTGFRWLIDDSNLATIDDTGLVTFKKAGGPTFVRAFYGNAADAPNGSGSLTVNPNPP